LELVVEEELPIGSAIGEVQAIDDDEGDNAVIDYAIIGQYTSPLKNIIKMKYYYSPICET
jgi:hypothetical protein